MVQHTAAKFCTYANTWTGYEFDMGHHLGRKLYFKNGISNLDSKLKIEVERTIQPWATA